MQKENQTIFPEFEERLKKNVGGYESLERECIDAMQKAEESEKALMDCAREIVSTVINEWNHFYFRRGISELHEGRFSINRWEVVIEHGFAHLYFTEIYDRQSGITIIPENIHHCDSSCHEKVEAFLEGFIEYFRKRTNKISLGMAPYVMAPP